MPQLQSIVRQEINTSMYNTQQNEVEMVTAAGWGSGQATPGRPSPPLALGFFGMPPTDTARAEHAPVPRM